MKAPHDWLPRLYWGVFLLAIPLITFLMALKPVPSVLVPVPNHELTAYHVITTTDLTTLAVPLSSVTTDTLRDSSKLLDHYTRDTLPASHPVHEGQIIPISTAIPTLISSTHALAIPADATLTFGNTLQAGDIVSVSSVPHSTSIATPSVVLDTVLVLDVKTVMSETVVILAVPDTRWTEYLVKTQNAQIILARPVK
jgi:hypothetical protein